MNTRHPGLTAALATVLLFAVAGAALFACGGKDTASPEVTSAPRPTTTTTDAGDLDLPEITVPDLTIPDDVGDSVGKISDCSDVVLAYTQLAITVLQGDGAQSQVDAILAKVRPKVPADLQDDLEVVGDTYAKAAEAGIVQAPQVLDEPKFRTANRAIGVDMGGN